MPEKNLLGSFSSCLSLISSDVMLINLRNTKSYFFRKSLSVGALEASIKLRLYLKQPEERTMPNLHYDLSVISLAETMQASQVVHQIILETQSSKDFAASQ